MNYPVAGQRVIQSTADTLTYVNLDQNGTAVDAGAVTIGIRRADGTVLVAAGTATTSDGAGTYTYVLTAANTSTLDLLTATWTLPSAATISELVEIRGAWYFSLAQARSSDTTLLDSNKFTDADIIYFRSVAEAELDWICSRSFTPRFRRITVDGDGSKDLYVVDNDLRTVTAASTTSQSGTVYSLTSTDLANLVVYEDLRIRRPIGNAWDDGDRNVTIAYTYGLDNLPDDLHRALLMRFRELLNNQRGGVPARASSYTEQGVTYQLEAPGSYRTGNSYVDQVYERYSKRTTDDGVTHGPVSRTMSYDPQRNSLYHGGPR